ncbi:hypothetical protein D3C75_903280 [compost metagenome]
MHHRVEHQVHLVEGQGIGGCLVAHAKMGEPVVPVQAVPGRCIELDQRQCLQRGQAVDLAEVPAAAGDRVDHFVEQLAGLQRLPAAMPVENAEVIVGDQAFVDVVAGVDVHRQPGVLLVEAQQARE